MTANEWKERVDGQGVFTLTTFTFDDIIADLAAKEAELAALREELADYRAYYNGSRESPFEFLTPGGVAAEERIEARRKEARK